MMEKSDEECELESKVERHEEEHGNELECNENESLKQIQVKRNIVKQCLEAQSRSHKISMKTADICCS